MSIPLFKQQQIQRITNDKGTATKFPDGTMICYCNRKFITGATYGEIYCSFPVSFSNTSYSVSVLGNMSPDNTPKTLGENNRGNNFIELIVFKNASERLLNKEITVNITAIGRWK